MPGPNAAAMTGWQTGGLRTRWLAMRDRLVTRAAFRQRLAANPLTRPVARSRANRLFDITAGFVYSQILSACVELDVFRLLAAGPLPLARIAQVTGLEADAALRLVSGAVALDLLEWRGDGIAGLGELGAAMVDNPGVTAMVRHHALLYADMADPVALLRDGAAGTRLSAFWPYAADRARDGVASARAAEYSELMAASQAMIVAQLLDAYDFGSHRRLLDIGGGDGVLAGAVAARHAHLEVEVFDLPAVAERARAAFAREGLAARARATGGNFFTDRLPAGADLVSLVRVLFDHDDASALAVLKAARAALAPGGTLLVAEPMAGARVAPRVGDAYFGFYLLAMGKGRSRSSTALAGLVAEAGFTRMREVDTALPLACGLLVARP